MGRLIIVSNRLPVSPSLGDSGEVEFSGSVGGLATGLGSFYQSYDSLWIGWCETSETLPCDHLEVRERLRAEHACLPVFLDPGDVDLYYHGFSNETIWPIFHHFSQYAVFDAGYWDAYVRVNQRFCDVVAEEYRPGDLIWVNDYHLMLLPGMLRERFPEATVGFFLHIPFPSFEIFRILPWRDEIVHGLLGADVVGFHTYDYARHFLSSVLRLTGIDHVLGEVTIDARPVRVDAFPMGIDFDRFAKAARSAEAERHARRLRDDVGDRAFVLSVDRLDYTKGIPGRLEAFERFLAEHPAWRRRVALTMVAVPSRTSVDHYQQLKRHVDELVGRVNGRFGTMDWTPVRYLYRSLPFEELVAMYREADAILVTPLRDGMNLVAKEYVATKGDTGLGVLVLSEMAGAAKELGEAVVVNPFDVDAMAAAIVEALEMPSDEQRARLDAMQGRLRRYDVVRWAQDLVGAMEHSAETGAQLDAQRLSPVVLEALRAHYDRAEKRLVLLDYDGTLVGFSPKPASTVPDEALLETLRALSADPRNEVVVISGRGRPTLAEWLGDLDIRIVAEHGGLVRDRDGEWRLAASAPERWKESIRPIMERFVDRTPGSLVEEKETSIVWHYRAADPGLGPLRARELRSALGHLTENLDLAVLEGKRVLEVKPAGVNKGRAALELLDAVRPSFVLAVGDDRTDEDVFEALPEWAYTVKVGGGPSRARFRAASVDDVRSLIDSLVG